MTAEASNTSRAERKMNSVHAEQLPRLGVAEKPTDRLGLECGAECPCALGGRPMNDAPASCPRCKRSLQTEGNFCPNCGSPLSGTKSAVGKKTQLVHFELLGGALGILAGVLSIGILASDGPPWAFFVLFGVGVALPVSGIAIDRMLKNEGA